MTPQEKAEIDKKYAPIIRGRKLTKDLIAIFQEVRQNDPATFYRSMGYDPSARARFQDEGIDIMDPFFEGSYELGLIAGARYALEHLTHLLKEDNK